ncbi:MAG: hypothetical protein J6Y37_15180 [Paludibacteraceae bacterium]|nr:hypothetical protein [Paludibacteraceae bacterium]
MFVINNGEEYEPLCNVVLTKEKFPKAFAAKVREVMGDGICTSQEEAEKYVAGMEIELEVYYEEGEGLFAVESERLECGEIYSPYTCDRGVYPVTD